MTMISRPDEAGLRTLIEALPEMLDEPNAEGWSLVRRSDVIRALDAARARPDEAGLREAVQAYVDWQYRQRDAPRFTLTALRAALAQPAVPVAGVEGLTFHTQEADANGVWCREDGQKWPCDVIRAAQPEDDGLDHSGVVEAIWREVDEHWQDIATCSCGEWTPYGSVGTTFAWHVAQKVAARLSESSEGVERRDGA